MRILNALGQENRIAHGDPRFPGLVTETRAPNGFITWASFDDRGNVVASTDCGLGGRVHPQIAWAKLRALAEGAALV